MKVKIPQSDRTVRVTVVREGETIKHNFWPGPSREVEIDAEGGRVYVGEVDDGNRPVGDPREVVDPEAERLEAERLEAERLEAERLEAERLEAEEARLLAELEAEEATEHDEDE